VGVVVGGGVGVVVGGGVVVVVVGCGVVVHGWSHATCWLISPSASHGSPPNSSFLRIHRSLLMLQLASQADHSVHSVATQSTGHDPVHSSLPRTHEHMSSGQQVSWSREPPSMKAPHSST
jgi:hypothetical protein